MRVVGNGSRGVRGGNASSLELSWVVPLWSSPPTYLQWSPYTPETANDLCSSHLSSCRGLGCGARFSRWGAPAQQRRSRASLLPGLSALHYPCKDRTHIPCTAWWTLSHRTSRKSPLLQCCPFSRTSPPMLWIKPVAHQHIFKTSC